MRKLVITCKLVLLLSLTVLLTGCGGFEYRGDYPELFSVAVNSILGAQGFQEGGWPRPIQPYIRVLEEDNYGRRLFIYTEDVTIGVSSYRVIIQKVEGDYAYFYPHYNFGRGRTDEAVEALKEANSWNQ